ncbi:unnamed protein product [Pylaiella littoralis]
MQSSGLLRRGFRPQVSISVFIQARRGLSACLVLSDGSIRVDNYDGPTGPTLPPPGPGRVTVKLVAAPCTPVDLRTLATAASAAAADPSSRTETDTLALHSNSSTPSQRSPSSTPHSPSPPHHLSNLTFPFVGGSEGLWEVIAKGDGVSELRPGNLAVPAMMPAPRNAPGAGSGSRVGNALSPPEEESGMWRTAATLAEASLVRVPMEIGVGGGGWREVAVAAHCSSSVSTAIRILEDFAEKELGAGDPVVFTGASSAVAQILLQLAALRGLESVCLVNSDAEAALALKLGARKAPLLKEFKAMRMDNALMVADGEGGVLGFTAARALRFRGCYVSYADVSGGGVSLPVAGQIFRDTKCRGFSLSRWASTRLAMESRELVRRSVATALAAQLRLEETREFDLNEAVAAIETARTPGGPVILRGG